MPGWRHHLEVFDGEIHVWPDGEEHLHDFRAAVCRCKPEVERMEKASIVSHNELVENSE